MNSEEVVGLIELGNINLKCLIFKINNNKAEILSTSITRSNGFHNDIVVNLSKASNSIRSCINEAEKKASVTLKKINVILEQPDFLCTKFSKHKKIDGSKIQKDDIEFLLKEAKKQLIYNDKRQSIIHIFNHNYLVDGKSFIEEPINVYADSFTHEITFVTIPKNNLKNINQVFINCDIEIERLFSRIFALGVELLNYKKLGSGIAIVDFDVEKISFGLFKNLALVHSVTFPIGTNHITRDISKVCSLNYEESEKIVNEVDFSYQDNNKIFDESNYLKDSYFLNSNYRKISKKLISEVIKSRIDEILSLLRKQLIVPGFNLNSGIDLVLVGEGSKLLNIEKNFVNFFGPNVKKQSKNIFTKELNLESCFTSCLGTIKIIKEGWETEAIPEKNNENIEKIGFFAKFLKLIK